MPHTQSLPRRRDAAVRQPALRRIRAALSLCLAAAVCLVGVAVEGTGWMQGGEVVLLRSFAQGASARIEIGAGNRPRLVAENLPPAGSLTPDARAYVVWATAGAVRRLGVLRRNSAGAFEFEFRHPAGLPRYGVVVTAEPSADASRPAGAPVFASRALEVSAAPATRAPSVTTAARDRAVTTPRDSRAATTTNTSPPTNAAGTTTGAAVSAEAEERARICVGLGRDCGSGFAREVWGATARRRSRKLLLVAARGAGSRTRGVAHVSNVNDAAYARLRLRRVPPPSRFGARRHVLWAVTDEAGPIYLGSLPEAGINRAHTFVRADGLTDPTFRLLITAEQTYPAPRPAGRRVLLTFKGRRRSRK